MLHLYKAFLQSVLQSPIHIPAGHSCKLATSSSGHSNRETRGAGDRTRGLTITKQKLDLQSGWRPMKQYDNTTNDNTIPVMN